MKATISAFVLGSPNGTVTVLYGSPITLHDGEKLVLRVLLEGRLREYVAEAPDFTFVESTGAVVGAPRDYHSCQDGPAFSASDPPCGTCDWCREQNPRGS